jgi:hypothetical protein
MSKMDALRAMREARYAETTTTRAPAGRDTSSAAAPKRATKVSAPKPATTKARPAKVEATDGELCGHRNMSGRSCTRAHGHSEKSHRYS